VHSGMDRLISKNFVFMMTPNSLMMMPVYFN
jgi:hypothetical protein